MTNNNILVSAIVSVYNSELYIRGLMSDLMNQTLYKSGKLEIVLVNSGSEENEDEIIKEYITPESNITYLKTENRESIYQAWNRGIKAASGKYITNANTDDRHRNDALEIMASLFENNPGTDLVYANTLKTDIANDTYYSNTPKERLNWIDFDKDLILFGCYIGPQPMWKKSLHDKYGLFDENLKVVGDYEFWLRISRDAVFTHINDYLGLYYYHDTSAEHRNMEKTRKENDLVIKHYQGVFIRDEKELNRIQQKVNLVSDQIKSESYRANAVSYLDYRRSTLDVENYLFQKYNGQDLIKYFSSGNPDTALSFNIIESLIKKRDIPHISVVRNLQNKIFSSERELLKREIIDLIVRIEDKMGLEDNNSYETIDKLLDKGIGLLENRNYDESIEIFKKILTIDARNLDALNNLSVAEAFSGNYENSATYIEQVLKIDPTNEIAGHNLTYLESLINGDLDKQTLLDAEEMIEKQDYDGAEEKLNDILSKNDKDVDALNDLSVISILRGKFEDAAVLINRVLDVDAKNTTAIENLTTLEKLVDKELKEVRAQMKENENEGN